MLLQMILKEWKEKFGLFLFALAGYGVFSAAFVISSQEPEALDLLMGTMVLVFVPVISLLLGASGFFTEFRNDAWAYLFSRPVRKWQIWLVKYVSLLSLQVVILLVFQLITEFHPAARAARQMFTIPLRYGEDLSFPVLSVLFPLSLFTIAYSFSILSERSHVVVFLAALITYALGLGLIYGTALVDLIPSRLWPLSSSLTFIRPGVLLAFVGPLIPVSFAAASILTLSRADFSQPRRRTWVFTKFAAVFLAASLSIGAVVTYGSVGLRRSPSILLVASWGGRAYFETDGGLYRFDPAAGSMDRLTSSSAIAGQVVGGGGKVAYSTFSVSGRLRARQDLWIIDAEGKKPRRLIRTSDAGSPLRGASIYQVALSSGGEKVLFMARDISVATDSLRTNLWSVNTDGTGLKGWPLDQLKGRYCWTVGFADSNRSVLMSVRTNQRDWDLIKVKLESGAVEILAEGVNRPRLQPGGSPGREPSLIGYIEPDRDRSVETLKLMDIVTLEKRGVYEADEIFGFRWNPAGDKLAFVTGYPYRAAREKAELGVYSVAEGRVLHLKKATGYNFGWQEAPVWAPGDGFVLHKRDQRISALSLLDGTLTEQKTIPLPFTTLHLDQVLCEGQHVFVVNREKNELWWLDLGTDQWQRIS